MSSTARPLRQEYVWLIKRVEAIQWNFQYKKGTAFYLGNQELKDLSGILKVETDKMKKNIFEKENINKGLDNSFSYDI